MSAQVTDQKRRGGRKPKDPDPRPQVTGRVPTPHHEIYVNDAASLGINLTDYVALMMARGKGLDEPKYVLRLIDEAKRARERAAEEAERESNQDGFPFPDLEREAS